VGVKLRRVGPDHVRQRCPLYCQTALRLVQGGRGEAFAVAGVRDASVVWAGGYIQVGMRGDEWVGIARRGA